MKRIIKITAVALACLVVLLILLVGGYVGYVAIQYYRIEDMQPLDVAGNAENKVQTGGEYTALTYNAGFGAYSPEFTFFMDTGTMADGTEVSGKYAKGMSAEDVQKNVDGQIAVVKESNADFVFLQEVDESAHRSYGINMRAAFTAAFPEKAAAYAENFHTAYLLYPFNDPIGKSQSGILTLSSYKIENAVRRSFPVTDAFLDKFFDLDRCFSVHYLPVEGTDKQLALVNLHMSAYDEGGTIRAQQLKMLNGVLAEEAAKGNYVVAGGDFNHCLIADYFESDEEALAYFPAGQAVPDWVKNSVLHESELAEGFRLVSSLNAATCRGADIPYEKGLNYSTVIDGFIVSENVEAVAETVDTGYAFSDHNPVKLTFRLKELPA